MRGVSARLGLYAVGLLIVLASTAEAQSYSAHISGVWLGGGPCHYDSRSSGLAVGLGARVPESGALFIGGAADVLVAPIGSVDCLTDMPLAQFEGETVEVRGGTEHDPSVRARIESGVTLRPLRTQLVAGAGLIGLRTSYPSGFFYSRTFTLQPWFGVTATWLSPDAPFGLRVELGRHRIPYRYYRPSGAPPVDRTMWHTMVMIGLAIHLGGPRAGP